LCLQHEWRELSKSLTYNTNFNLQGDLILEVGHIIEAVTKIVDVTKKSQNVKIMEPGT
jgi:hypothetical protein